VTVLEAEGIPKSALDFALTLGGTGAGRNWLCLLTAGENILSVDDDVVCNTWRCVQSPRLLFGGHMAPRRHRFYTSRQEALTDVEFESIDLLQSHNSILGWSLPALMRSHPDADVSQSCPHILDGIRLARASEVVVSMSGLVGDSGTHCPYQWLFAPPSVKDELLRDEAAAFKSALQCREMSRIAADWIVSHDPHYMAFCAGLANTDVRPPFLPFGRNQDGLFGAMLSASNEHAFFGHVPVGIVHNSDREATYDQPAPLSATRVRVADLLGSITKLHARSLIARSSNLRMEKLGQALTELSALPADDFVRVVTRIVLRDQGDRLVRADAALAAAPSRFPSVWRTALEDYRDTLLANMRTGQFCFPAEWQYNVGHVDFSPVQDFVGDFGELIQIWRDVWALSLRRNLVNELRFRSASQPVVRPAAALVPFQTIDGEEAPGGSP
jgi:hypothetical protein